MKWWVLLILTITFDHSNINITLIHLCWYEVKSSGHGEDLAESGKSWHFDLFITSASFKATLYSCKQLILPWNLFVLLFSDNPPTLTFVLFACVCSQFPSSNEKYSTWCIKIIKNTYNCMPKGFY